MKKKIALRLTECTLMIITVLQIAPCVSAHTTSQKGILESTYSMKYDRYYIGGEEVGWRINEDYHTNGQTIIYSFSADDDIDNYKTIIRAGLAKWSNTGIFITREMPSGSGIGKIGTINESDSSAVAQFCQGVSNSSGHLTSWKIQLNVARSNLLDSTVVAHELGHAIGLSDLYSFDNSNKLMYGYKINMTATAPTASDLWGAKVITGLHTSHTWNYKYYGTSGQGINSHLKYCTVCNGRSTISSCTYNSKNICEYCGMRKNTSLNSIDPKPE